MVRVVCQRADVLNGLCCTRHYTTIVFVAQYYFLRKCKSAAMVFHKY